MREFVAKFNKFLERMPVNSRPNARNQKSFFLGAMPPDISFQMRRNVPADLAAAQTMAIELEDDLIIARKWRKDVQYPGTQASTSTDSVVQRLVNDVIALKRQQPKVNFYPNQYQNPTGRNNSPN